jgi:hypothetical protein
MFTKIERKNKEKDQVTRYAILFSPFCAIIDF